MRKQEPSKVLNWGSQLEVMNTRLLCCLRTDLPLTVFLFVWCENEGKHPHWSQSSSWTLCRWIVATFTVFFVPHNTTMKENTCSLLCWQLQMTNCVKHLTPLLNSHISFLCRHLELQSCPFLFGLKPFKFCCWSARLSVSLGAFSHLVFVPERHDSICSFIRRLLSPCLEFWNQFMFKTQHSESNQWEPSAKMLDNFFFAKQSFVCTVCHKLFLVARTTLFVETTQEHLVHHPCSWPFWTVQ